MNQSNYGLESVTLENLTFEIVEGMNGGYIRPYNMNVNENTVNAIGEFHERGMLGQLTPSIIASNMSEALTIGAPSHLSEMPMGWGTIRARFVLNVRMAFSGMSGTTLVTISGFTDYYDQSAQGTVDPNVSLIVNSYHTTKDNGLSTGVVALSRVDAFDSSSNMTLYDMSPSVAVGSISTNALISQHQYADLEVADTSTMLKTKPTQTDRSFLNPTTYIAKLINDYTKISAGSEEISSMRESFSTDENMNLAYTMHSGDYRTNPFIAYMADTREQTVTTRSFTLNDLFSLDPSLDERFNIVDSRMNGASYHRDSQDLSSASIEGHIAHTVSSTVPSIMTALGAGTLTFTATNLTIDGLATVSITSIGLTNGTEATGSHVEYITNRILSEVMIPLSMNNMYQFQIVCEINITADASIEVHMDQGMPTPFSIPIFADSLFSPILTDSQDKSQALTMNVESLLNYVATPSVQNVDY